ncbi:hypothetical protein_gp031 [Bacillus phage vB_BceM_WH1]|nr:hypothetical protein_gp031 [Bacillus phage vB_BceM_WH1]
MELFKGDTRFVLSMDEFYEHLEDDTLDDLVYVLVEAELFQQDDIVPIPFTEEDFSDFLLAATEHFTDEDERVVRHNIVLERYRLGI